MRRPVLAMASLVMFTATALWVAQGQWIAAIISLASALCFARIVRRTH